jgi:hypothetical protein
MQFKKTVLSAAVATTVGIGAAGFTATAQADLVSGTWEGVFSMLSSSGGAFANSDTAACLTETQANAWNGAATYTGGCDRSFASGSLAFDTANGSGTGAIDSYSFFGGGLYTASAVAFQAIGDGAGGPGTLVLGNMLFHWNGTYSIPVSIVLDAAGFFGAPAAVAASANGDGGVDVGAVMATVTANTTTIGGGTLGTNPSGTLPLIADTIGGSPMTSGPFAGSNANFDIMLVTSFACTDTGTGTNFCGPGPVVPVPAAVWLFGSGLLGLVGVARRRKTS